MDVAPRPDDISCVLYEGLAHWVNAYRTYGGNTMVTLKCTFKTHGAARMPLPMEFPTCIWCVQWRWV